MIEDDAAHERVGAGAAVGGATVAGGHGNGAVVGVQALALFVGTIAIRVAVFVVENDTFGDGRSVVSAIDEHGAFVDVGVTGEDEVDATAFEDGHDVLAHFDELAFPIGVV